MNTPAPQLRDEIIERSAGLMLRDQRDGRRRLDRAKALTGARGETAMADVVAVLETAGRRVASRTSALRRTSGPSSSAKRAATARPRAQWWKF